MRPKDKNALCRGESIGLDQTAVHRRQGGQGHGRVPRRTEAAGVAGMTVYNPILKPHDRGR